MVPTARRRPIRSRDCFGSDCFPVADVFLNVRDDHGLHLGVGL